MMYEIDSYFSEQNASIEVDLRTFFNRRCDFYTYAGSITTPTCHESVRWVIMRDPIMVTERAVSNINGNLPMQLQYTEIFFQCVKIENLIGKKLIFLTILLKTLIVGTR